MVEKPQPLPPIGHSGQQVVFSQAICKLRQSFEANSRMAAIPDAPAFTQLRAFAAVTPPRAKTGIGPAMRHAEASASSPCPGIDLRTRPLFKYRREDSQGRALIAGAGDFGKRMTGDADHRIGHSAAHDRPCIRDSRGGKVSRQVYAVTAGRGRDPHWDHLKEPRAPPPVNRTARTIPAASVSQICGRRSFSRICTKSTPFLAHCAACSTSARWLEKSLRSVMA